MCNRVATYMLILFSSSSEMTGAMPANEWEHQRMFKHNRHTLVFLTVKFKSVLSSQRSGIRQIKLIVFPSTRSIVGPTLHLGDPDPCQKRPRHHFSALVSGKDSVLQHPGRSGPELKWILATDAGVCSFLSWLSGLC